MSLLGQVLDGKYRIVRLIGEGGMGAVYEGENVRIKRRVAIKVLLANISGSAEAVQRFEREAQAAGTIGNDHILEVLDLGTLESGDRYMVMEFLDGESLSSRIERNGKLDARSIALLIRQTLEGLAAAHQAGIVHRDLKPDNVFILKEKAGVPDFVKLIDFGISKFHALDDSGMSMTRTGTMMGTPYYMSPEQASGNRAADARSDLYAVGVMMFEAVTGKVPFDGETFNQLLFKIVLAELPSARAMAPDLDPAFETLIQKAMARDADARFQTAHEFIQALDGWLHQGAGVAVPVAGDASNLLPPSSFGNVPLRKTAGTWAKSQPGVTGPRGPSRGLIAGGAIAVVAAVAGAAFVLGSAKGAVPVAETAAAPVSTPTAPATTTALPAPSSAPLVTPEPVAAAAAPSATAAEVAAPKKATGRAPVRAPVAAPKKGSDRDFGY